MNIAYIGLGAMGRAMASNLAEAGLLHCVWNRSKHKSEDFVRQHSGVVVARSLVALAEQCHLIFTCVSADDDLVEVVDALLPGLQENTILVDTSTVSADCSRQLSARLADMGVVFLDAPVSGGVEGAVSGQLSMMVGGDREALDIIRTVLEVIATKVIYMGESGAGQATKAVNQIMAAGINQAVSEALAFAEAMQLDMQKVIDVVGGGAAGNWFLQHRGASMSTGQYKPGFKVALHHKDLGLCRQMIQSMADTEKSLPIVEMTLLHYQRLIDEGYADEDISSLFRLKRRLFK